MAASMLVVVFMLVGLLALIIGFGAPGRVIPAPSVGAATVWAADRHLRRSRLVGLVLGILTAVVLWEVDALGRGPMLAGAGFGLVFLVATCVGELTSPVSRSVRSDADLRRRRLADHLPRGLTAVVAANVLVLGALLVVGLVTGSADDMGRSGRALSWTTSVGSAAVTPWPGSFYALPMLGALAVELAVATIALRIVASRAQIVATDAGVEVDRALRAGAARGVVSAAGVATAFPLAGLALVMAMTAANAVGDDGAPEWIGIVVWAACGAALLAVATIALSAASLLRSSAGRIIRDDRDDRAEDLESGAA
jgi:hypothetical protein